MAMDVSKFTNNATGDLVSIDGRKDFAFIPDPLPEVWEVPGHLASIWAEARERLGELRGIASILPDSTLLLHPLRQREALRSSSLEGTYATPQELLAYEMNPKNPSSGKDPANAWREVFNYGEVLKHGQEMIENGQPFSEWFIRYLHRHLLRGVRGEDKSPGEIRKSQVYIGATRRYNPPPPEYLPRLLGELERGIQSETGIDPLIRALMIHYQFEAIHPFRDGNGRVGRLLFSLMVYKNCDLDAPWLYLSEYLEENREEYMHALFNVSAEGDWARWIHLGLLATIDAGNKTVRRIRKLLKIREEYEAKIRESQRWDRLMHIVPRLLSSPIIGYQDLVSTLDIAYPTARNYMNALVSMGIVTEIVAGSGRQRKFVANEIFRTAYIED